MRSDEPEPGLTWIAGKTNKTVEMGHKIRTERLHAFYRTNTGFDLDCRKNQ